MPFTQVIRLIIQFVFLIASFSAAFSGSVALEIVYMAVALVAGSFFCGWGCPFGLVQDLMIKVRKKFRIGKLTPPTLFIRYSLYSRYLILILSFGFLALEIVDLHVYDPRINFLKIMSQDKVVFWGWQILLFFCTISLFYDRPFCNFFCFEGAIYGFLSQARRATIRKDPDLCTKCLKCDRICPMNISISQNEQARSQKCINCFQCISGCSKQGALKYR